MKRGQIRDLNLQDQQGLRTKRPRRMKRGQIRDLNVQDQQGPRDQEE